MILNRVAPIIEKNIYIERPLLGFPRVSFCRHAWLRMKQRGVSESDVYRTIEHPDETGLPTLPHRLRVRWHKSERWSIDVVYELTQECPRIITVIRISRSAPKGSPPKLQTRERRQPNKRKRR